MGSSEKSTVRELLSNDELEALLGLFSEEGQERTPLFDVGLSRVARGIEHYLERTATACDRAEVLKNVTAPDTHYRYLPEYRYLESLTIENSLALTILGLRFGAGREEASPDRPLTPLEKALLDDFCREVVYLVEKELEAQLLKGAAAGPGYGVRLSFGQNGGTIGFVFRQAPLSVSPVEERPAPENVAEAGTTLEVSIGTVAAARLHRGTVYAVHTFGRDRAVLLLDARLPFVAKRLPSEGPALLYALEEAITETGAFSGYYLSVASASIDDEMLLALEQGTVVTFEPYTQTLVRKDGKIVAKAQLLLRDGEAAVRITETFA